MGAEKRILSYIRRAAEDYGMICRDDRIAVGVSGGKDSLALLWAMAQLRRFWPQPFELGAITVDMGFEGADYGPLQAFCDQLDVPLTVVPTQIAQVVFDIRKEKNPCSLCAKLRRGSLHSTAAAQGYNKVALGHHLDDVAETMLMNLFHEGRIGSFAPVTFLDRSGITLIRPMIYLPEKQISYFARHTRLPVTESLCPANRNTQRQVAKDLIASLDRQNSGTAYRIFGALQRGEISGYRPASALLHYEKADKEAEE